MKELGYTIPTKQEGEPDLDADDNDDDDEDEEDEEEEEEEEPGANDDEEQVIHMYSDEGESQEPSQSIMAMK